ncbi:M14 family metallopeptidase [Wenzhouxiangella sp. EGI_FJ10409]|uniref:M14 family metallopeptidase n=1 Tax=Wenzhouxiangella sp. EGI_FJ10409 TaxID=3243767 RepID=UPI0035DD55CF
MHIHSKFDSGNIEVLEADSPDNIRLKIRPDAGGEHMQWFHFQLSGARDADCRMTIENAGDVSYPDGFEDYHAVASTDRVNWFRVPTEFDGKQLVIKHRPDSDIVYYAYFAPYSQLEHENLIAAALVDPRVRAEVLCSTPDGRAHTMLRIGDPDEGRKKIWVIARQHPGETMAEWWVEGFLERLLDTEEPVSRKLLEQAVVYLVPNMCLDGAVRGHLRCNAKGRNLNREWAEPSEEDSPEVYYTRQKMHATGVDMAFDVHGDEALPYNFIAGAEGTPSWNEKKQLQLDNFEDLLARISPDFQTKVGYEVDAPNSSDLKKNTDYTAETFDCLAMTLEMPFKDNADLPMPEVGWSPERSKHLGSACVDAFWRILPEL